MYLIGDIVELKKGNINSRKFPLSKELTYGQIVAIEKINNNTRYIVKCYFYDDIFNTEGNKTLYFRYGLINGDLINILSHSEVLFKGDICSLCPLHNVCNSNDFKVNCDLYNLSLNYTYNHFYIGDKVCYKGEEYVISGVYLKDVFTRLHDGIITGRPSFIGLDYVSHNENVDCENKEYFINLAIELNKCIDSIYYLIRPVKKQIFNLDLYKFYNIPSERELELISSNSDSEVINRKSIFKYINFCDYCILNDCQGCIGNSKV